MIKTRKPLRLPKYDYSQQGVYFVTFCTNQKECTLSTVGCADLGAPSVQLTSIGEMVEQYIQTIPTVYQDVLVDSYVIMPNHVHMLISVSRPEVSVSRIIGAVKRFSNRDAGHNLWQRSFYDHIVRDENDYVIRYNYIADNPRRWAEDEYYSNR